MLGNSHPFDSKQLINTGEKYINIPPIIRRIFWKYFNKFIFFKSLFEDWKHNHWLCLAIEYSKNISC